MKAFILLLLSVAPFYAQEKKTPEPAQERVSRLITVKYLSGADFENAIQLLRSFGASVEGRSSMRVIAVSGSAGLVTAVEEAIKRMDVPPAPTPASKNIEITLHVIMASNKPGDGTVPADLDGVLKQMRGVFQYQSYKLLDTQLIRTRDNSRSRGDDARFSGILPASNGVGEGSFSYEGSLYPSSSEDSRGRSFRLDRFVFVCKPRNAPGVNVVTIRTDIDVREGQKVVVGKSNLDSDSTIFLVVSAKQVD